MLSFESLYWLGANDEGKSNQYLHSNARFRYALAALVLMEMALKKNIAFDEEKQLCGIASNPPEDELLCQVWDLCTIPKKVKWIWRTGKKQDIALNIKDWISVMVNENLPIFDMVKARLIEKKILQTQKASLLGIFKYDTTTVASDIERNIYRKKLENIVLNHEKFSLHDFFLLKVVKACKIYPFVFPSKIAKEQAQFAKELDDWCAQKIVNEEVIAFLEELDFEKELEEISEALEALLELIDSIGDASADGSDGGADGGGGDGGGE
jgi:hypothetical protein